MEKVPLDELTDDIPPQPASANRAGSPATASARAGQCRSEWAFRSGFPERAGRFRSIDGSEVFWLNSSGAFLAVSIAFGSFDALPAPVPKSEGPGHPHRGWM
jgi:hypothetical protein